MKYIRLGDVLTKSGTISQEQLDQALVLQKQSGKRLGTVLIDEGIIQEQQLIQALTDQLGVEYIDLNAIDIPADLVRMVPKSLAKKYAAVPVRASRSDLFLAMADPLNFVAVEEITTVSRRHVIPMIATEAAVQRAIHNLYGSQGASRAIEEMRYELSSQSASAGVSAQSESVVVDEEDNSSAPAIRLVNSIIDRAYTEHASDIHLEPGEDMMRIRIRVDGMLHEIITVPKELESAVISRLKVMARMDIAQRNLPQDGHVNVTIRREVMDLRVSTLPTVYGEKVVLRMLRKNPELISMKGIGLEGENLRRFKQLVGSVREGAVLMVGPTGSGKTSTMYTIIDQLKSESLNLVSLEDPVEFYVDQVCQVQINERTGLTFASALRSVLRQDPDIIAVGEIRDGETADIAMRAAITGHLVLSTIHTNNALSSIDRLLDIGVEPYVLAGAVRGIISQRLLRRICPYCRQAYTPDAEERRYLGLPAQGDETFYRGAGCDACFHTGYRGRVGAFEILNVTAPIRQAIYANDRTRLADAMAQSDFQPIMDNCRDLVLEGVTSADEVRRIVG